MAPAALLSLAACGGEEPAPAPEPNALERQIAAPKQVKSDVEKTMEDAQARRDAEMRAAAGEPADTAARP